MTQGGHLARAKPYCPTTWSVPVHPITAAKSERWNVRAPGAAL